MAQNEMRAKCGLPVEVRSMEGLGVGCDGGPPTGVPSSLLNRGSLILLIPWLDTLEEAQKTARKPQSHLSSYPGCNAPTTHLAKASLVRQLRDVRDAERQTVRRRKNQAAHECHLNFALEDISITHCRQYRISAFHRINKLQIGRASCRERV